MLETIISRLGNKGSVIPPKLKAGDTIRVIAPSSSASIITGSVRELAEQRMRELGLNVTYGTRIEETGPGGTAPIASRIADLHEAFSDPSVQGVIAMIGGFAANQLLAHIDYELLRQHPKLFCGYSDITALQNAIYAKNGLVTYSGPAFSSFGMRDGIAGTIEQFRSCVMNESPIAIEPAKEWSDDQWYLDQDAREFHANPGYVVMQEGDAIGTVIGGNLCTLNLLQGTPYMPPLRGSILFIEDDEESKIQNFDRDLQSLMHLPEFSGVKGIVIGRFQKKSNVDMGELANNLRGRLPDIPVIANADFGHTTPILTFPIGGTAHILAKDGYAHITILKH